MPPIKNKKERNQIIMLAVVLALIFAVLLYYYADAFLPKPAGEPIVLEQPVRLQLPKVSKPDEALYTRADFQQLVNPADVPVRPVEINGAGSPFDDIFPSTPSAPAAP